MCSELRVGTRTVAFLAACDTRTPPRRPRRRAEESPSPSPSRASVALPPADSSEPCSYVPPPPPGPAIHPDRGVQRFHLYDYEDSSSTAARVLPFVEAGLVDFHTIRYRGEAVCRACV